MTQSQLTAEQVLEVIDSCVSACEEYVRFGEDNPRLNNLRATRTAVAQIIAERDALRKDAERGRWLIDRLEVRSMEMMNGSRRNGLQFRIGYGLLGENRDPTSGWTDQKYFEACKTKVLTAIDTSLTGTEE